MPASRWFPSCFPALLLSLVPRRLCETLPQRLADGAGLQGSSPEDKQHVSPPQVCQPSASCGKSSALLRPACCRLRRKPLLLRAGTAAATLPAWLPAPPVRCLHTLEVGSLSGKHTGNVWALQNPLRLLLLRQKQCWRRAAACLVLSALPSLPRFPHCRAPRWACRCAANFATWQPGLAFVQPLIFLPPSMGDCKPLFPFVQPALKSLHHA